MLLPDGTRQQHLPLTWKQSVFEAIEYVPFHNQGRFHASTAKHRIFAGGNRGGKTEAGAKEALCYLLWPHTRGWVVTRNYSLGKPLREKIINDLIYKLGMTQVPRKRNLKAGEFHWSEADHVMTMYNGSILEWKSADNPDSLHARKIDYAIIDEGAIFPYGLYDTRIVPRLADTGGWVAALGTFEYLQGDWFVEYFEIGQDYPNDWGIESWSQPTTANPHIDQEWLEEERKRLCKTEEGERIFKARYLAIPVVSAYLVFPQFSIETHIDKQWGEFDDDVPVYLAIDPGGTYAVAAVQFKMIPGKTNNFGNWTACLVDELYYTTTIESTEVIEDCKRRKWWHSVAGGAIDVAATEQRRIWMNYGGVALQARKVPIHAGTQTFAHWLSTETFLCHPDCTMWQHEINRYTYATPAVGREGEVDIRRKNPRDAFNHLIKAVIYLLITKHGFYHYKRQVIKRRKPIWGG